MVNLFNRLIAPYARRIRLTVSRGIIRLVDDSLGIQQAQVALLADELRDQVERFQQYGLTSVPHEGAEGIFLSVGGSRDHGIVIAVDDRRYRLKGLEKGEVALYDSQGQKLHFKQDGKIDVLALAEVAVSAPEVKITATTKVTMTTPKLAVSGVIEAGGDITDKIATGGRSMAGMRTIYNNAHPLPSPQM